MTSPRTLLVTTGVASLLWLGSVGVHAAITPTGQVTPAYPAGNPDPWNISPQRLLIGNTAVGRLTVDNGSFVSAGNGTTLGNLVSGNGALMLDGGGGAGGLNFFTTDMVVGAFGVGGVYLENNGFLDVQDDLVLGGLPPNGFGEIQVREFAQVRAGGNLVLGGDLTTDGGRGFISEILTLGSNIRFRVGDGPIDPGISFVNDSVVAAHGNGSAGNIVVRNGSAIDLELFTVYLGVDSGNQGSLRVTGTSPISIAKSRVAFAGVNLGHAGGAGTLTVEDQAEASTGSVRVARDSGATGTVNVTGGATLDANGLVMGSPGLLSGGVGTLNLQGTNSRLVLGDEVAGVTGTTVLLVNSAGLQVGTGSDANTQGTAYFGYETGKGGTLFVDGGNSTYDHLGSTQFAFETGSFGTAAVSANGRWTNTGSVVLGRNGAATLEATSGGTVEIGGDLLAGFDDDGDGDITLDFATIDVERSLVLGGDETTDGGTGSLTMSTTTGRLLVGDDADDFPVLGAQPTVMVSDDDTIGGSLVVRNGSDLTTVGPVWIASGTGENGEARVLGLDSTWDATGAFVVGRSGAGSLDLDGGRLNNTGDVFVGLNSNATGVIDFAGNGRLSTTGDLTIGGFTGGVGDVNLNGANSRLDIGDQAASLGISSLRRVVVADDDNDGGNLLLRNGGTLTAVSMEVGKGAGNRGAVFADGAGTLVDLAGTLTFGDDDGTGEATISNNALVQADAVSVFDGGTVELANAGRIKTRSLTVENGATLRGGGNVDPFTFATDPGVTNAGRVEPGNSIGDLYIGGPFTQTTQGTVQIELDATGTGIDHDLLLANGDIELTGTLELFTLAGSNPAYYDPRTVVESDESVTGVFETVNGIVIDATKRWAVVYLTRDVQVIAALPGDANLNGLVEQGDLNAVLSNWGQPGKTWETGDLDGNGFIDQADLNQVLNNWGSTAAPDLDGFTVPEPGVLGLFVAGQLVGARNNARRRST